MRFSFRLNRYVSEGDEAAAASGSDDDDDAEEEEVVEEEDTAPGKYKSELGARRERVTLLNTCRESGLIDSEQQLPKPRSARQNSPKRKSTTKRARMKAGAMTRIGRMCRDNLLVRLMWDVRWM